MDEIRRLKNSLRVVHSEKVELIVHNLIEKAEKLKPIKFYTVNDIREDRLMILNRELNDIYDDIMSVYLQYKIIDWNNREEALKRLKERLNQKRQLQMFNDRYQRIQIEIRDELLERRIGGKVFGDFKDFPTIDLIEVCFFFSLNFKNVRYLKLGLSIISFFFERKFLKLYKNFLKVGVFFSKNCLIHQGR